MNNQSFEDIYHNKLTPKQKEVIPFLLQGLSNKAIAEKLDIINANTVTHRISSIREKFEALDKSDLIYIFNNFKPELVTENGRKVAGITEKKLIPEVVYPECSEALNSPFYIVRETIDMKCQNLIDRPGCLLKIQAPKQMGKTSSINRIVDYAEQQDNYIVYYDLSFLDVKTLNNIDRFFYSLAAYIAEEISDYTGKDINLQSWNKANSLTTECTKFIKQVLRAIDKPLVLIFDETDRIFQYESVYQSFAPLLRYWHEKSKTSSLWKKLKLIISHSTEEYVKLNINQSPFANVGITVKLEDLTPAQVIELAAKHNIYDETVITSLIDLVGGHPYLIRLALYHLSQKQLPSEILFKEAATDSGIYRQHLQRHLERLQKNSELETAFKQIITSDRPITIKSQKLKHQLEGIGLITLKGNLATVRYQLYRQYFTDFLI
ncbi:MAG: AAA-like domain-containing protein [Cyanobacteria bacterium P01_A01_bin.83]